MDSDTNLHSDFHENCIKYIEAIRYFERKLESVDESIQGFPGTLPLLRQKLIRDSLIYKKCMKRIWDRYDKYVFEENQKLLLIMF